MHRPAAGRGGPGERGVGARGFLGPAAPPAHQRVRGRAGRVPAPPEWGARERQAPAGGHPRALRRDPAPRGVRPDGGVHDGRGHTVQGGPHAAQAVPGAGGGPQERQGPSACGYPRVHPCCIYASAAPVDHPGAGGDPSGRRAAAQDRELEHGDQHGPVLRQPPVQAPHPPHPPPSGPVHAGVHLVCPHPVAHQRHHNPRGRAAAPRLQQPLRHRLRPPGARLPHGPRCGGGRERRRRPDGLQPPFV
mmetsp:Transcript_40468/g.72418  ORF Transcript_40468/g.72418 Transcript_40468/m.72418 type:complete len:247 (-) Transcript_40468:401-1141(-)